MVARGSAVPTVVPRRMTVIVVGDREHLAELVGDEDDGQALGLEFAEVVEERVDLLRHEDRGGLVEDEGAGAAVEDLEDLHALAVGHAEFLDEGVGAYAEAVRVRDLLDLGAGPGADAVQLLAAEDDVLQHREVVGEHEVLVHHADAARDGVRRAAEDDLRAVDGDGPLVRLLHPVEDLHQGRLAGAVLTAEGVDGASAHGDVDVSVGDDTGEAFGDAVEFDGAGYVGRVGSSGCGRTGRVDGALTSGEGALGRGAFGDASASTRAYARRVDTSLWARRKGSSPLAGPVRSV